MRRMRRRFRPRPSPVRPTPKSTPTLRKRSKAFRGYELGNDAVQRCRDAGAGTADSFPAARVARVASLRAAAHEPNHPAARTAALGCTLAAVAAVDRGSQPVYLAAADDHRGLRSVRQVEPQEARGRLIC